MPSDCRKSISVIVPTRNAEAFLPATLASLSQQAGAIWECVFVDGASTDRSLELIESFRCLQHVRSRLISEPDDGVADAFNKGIALADSDYLYFLCAGDTLRPGILERVSQSLAESPEILYGKVYEVAYQKLSGGTVVSREDMACFNMYHQAMFYRADLFKRFGSYNSRYRSFSDYEFNLRCFGDPRLDLRVTDEVIADYLGGGPSEMGDPLFEEDREALVSMYLGPLALDAVKRRRSRQSDVARQIALVAQKGGRWAIYGAGAYGSNLVRTVLKQNEVVGALTGFFDSNSERWNSFHGGHRILEPTDSTIVAQDLIVIAIGSDRARDDVAEMLDQSGFPRERTLFW